MEFTTGIICEHYVHVLNVAASMETSKKNIYIQQKRDCSQRTVSLILYLLVEIPTGSAFVLESASVFAWESVRALYQLSAWL